MELKLTKAQISRLVMIFDEDIEGTITIEEYMNALEAYGCSCERRRSMDSSVLTQSFQHKCLFKLLTELQNKDITFSEVYNACDVNDDKVNLSEVRNFIEGLSPEFKQKEVQALIAYMDLDGDGLVTRDEFLR
jgi:Ca2+-binding EF-hand superfamily protein